MAFKKKKKFNASAEPEDLFAFEAPKEEKVATRKVGPAVERENVNLDQRKLTKKQKDTLAAQWDADKANALDKFSAESVLEVKKKFGSDTVMTASDTSNLIIGIPCPAMAFEYVIAQDVFPVGLILQLVGPPSAGKSTLLAEIFRWFILADGLGNLCEVESKISPDLLPSIITPEKASRVALNFCDSVESWQQRVLFWINHYKKTMVGTKLEPGPGRTIPVCLGVDSIMGKPALGTQEKVHKEGHGSRQFPEEALIITQWMKTVPQLLVGWPFALVLNNHLKKGKDNDGKDVRRTGGGEGTNFQESFELEVTKKVEQISCADWDGRVINIKCYKNSFGPTYRSADVRYLWWEEENEDKPGTFRQKTVFDWHWATVRLLTTLQGREAAALKQILHLKPLSIAISNAENLVWSSTLGIKEKDAVSWSEMGRLIAEDSDLLDAIRQAIGIKRRPLLSGDYSQQLKSLAEKER